MSKIKPIIFLLLLVGLVILAFFLHPKLPLACINGACFKVEMAVTPQQRERGLMYRNSLAADAGMLFVFDQEGVYSFWMKNTKIPLDMIWINKDKKIVFMAKNVQPCYAIDCPDIVPDGDALYVLEINAGFADKIGIKQGDQASFR